MLVSEMEIDDAVADAAASSIRKHDIAVETAEPDA
jgi:hypothetical protein